MILPINWPQDIEYTNIQSFQRFKNLKKKFIPGVEIKKINEIDHILNGQYGLFATQKFEPFDIVGQYTGSLVSEDVGGRYVASLENYGIDAISSGNELRFVNDYRNLANSENVTIKIAYIDKKPRVIFVVTKNINIGDQLLTDYGENYWSNLPKDD